MPRPDVEAIAAVAEDCANSRFATIRQIAAHMNDALAYVGELEAQVDVLTDRVAGRDERIERLRGELDQAKRGGKELGKIVVFLGELIKDAFKLGADDPIGALHMLGNHLAEILPDEGGLPLDEFNRTYHALEDRRRERDALRDQVAGRDATIQRVRDELRKIADGWRNFGALPETVLDRIKIALDGDPADDGIRTDG